jgi:hypothetical protein
MNETISAIGTAAAALFALVALLFAYRANNLAQKAIEASQRPSLVFACDVKAGWTLLNAGPGVALSVTVASRHKDGPPEWHSFVAVGPMEPSASVPVSWASHENVHQFKAWYSGVDGVHY